MCALQNHVVDALQSTGKILRPFHLVKNLRCISRNFRNSRQEDAHEYMINLLESMHKCCLPSGVASESPSAYEKSLVHKIFGGRLRSQVKCMQCSYCSNKFDPFLDLSLEIVKADTLCKALSHFTAEEQLDGGERQYQCQQCKQKVRALKQLTIHKAPYVLTIHLKRFGSDVPGQKIDKKVEFGPTLDLKPYVSDRFEGDLKYTLYGVLVHAGYGTHSGHYFCYVRTSSGMWHSLNDHQVCQVSEKAVLQQKAYMLFYVRNISTAPKKAHDIVCKDTRPVNGSGKKNLPVSFDFKEAIQDHPRDRGSTTSVCYIDILKANASSHGEAKPVKDISVAQHLLKKVSSTPTNGLMAKTHQSTLLEDHIFHSSSKMSSVEKTSRIGPPILNATGRHMVAEGPMHLDSSKDNGNQLLKKDDLQNMNIEGKGSSCKVVRYMEPEQATHNRSCTVGSSNGLRLTQLEHRAALLNEGESNDPVAAKLEDNALIEVDQIHPSSKRCTSCDSAQMEPAEHTDSPKVVMKRKLPKSSYIRNMPFGYRRLFLVSLNLRKRKIRRRSKKHWLITEVIRKAGIFEDNSQGDQGPSTSVAANIVDVDSIHVPKQRSHTGLGRENSFLRAGANHLSSVSANAKDVDVAGRYVSSSAGRSLCPETGQHHTGDACTSNKNSSQHGPLNLLTGGFWELSVPQWDAIELPPEIKVIDDEPQSVGYILDEWEKEEHRGKRKKVKSSRKSFAGGNPFEEICVARAQKKMKMDWSRSGNRPFRIYS
uniref:Ubiquitin carboxyl-terminal hydrolase 23 n=2 Tax=Anthurium amnicola TaxID=1678845 RepID=A0A1D1Y4Y7_9ARAE